MDENEFLRGLEGEEQKGTDLVQGAEQFIRLKKQVGLQQNNEEGLELAKEADLKEIATTAGKAATNFGKGIKNGVKWTGMGAKGAVHNFKTSKTPWSEGKAQAVGQIAGLAAPAVAAGAAGYMLGNREKKAADANRLIEALKKIDPGILAATGAGAAITGTGIYLGSRPQENGKSKAEESLEASVANNEKKPADGLIGKMRQANTGLMHNYSKAFRDHPVKAGLLGAVSGGVAGYGLGRMAGAAKPSIEALKAALRGGKK